MGKPRIAPEDYIAPDDVRPGMWIRAPWYGGDGHKVSAKDRTIFKCGRPVPSEKVRVDLYRRAGLEQELVGTPWYLAEDKRKTSKCSYCKNKKTPDHTLKVADETADDEATTTAQPPSPTPPRSAVSRWRWIRQQQHEAYLVALLKQELGAVVMKEGTTK